MAETEMKLRSISYQAEGGKTYTAFTAMTDDEFEDFRRKNDKSLEPHRGNIVHLIEGDSPSEEDVTYARQAFQHRFGTTTAKKHNL